MAPTIQLGSGYSSVSAAFSAVWMTVLSLVMSARFSRRPSSEVSLAIGRKEPLIISSCRRAMNSFFTTGSRPFLETRGQVGEAEIQ